MTTALTSIAQRLRAALGFRSSPSAPPARPKQPVTADRCPHCLAPKGLLLPQLPPHLAPQLSRNHDGQPMLTLGPLRWIKVGNSNDKWDRVPVPQAKTGVRHG